MSRFVALAVAVLIGAPLAAQAPAHQGMPGMQDADQKMEGSGKLPSGWEARLDEPDAKLTSVKAAAEHGGLHVTSGPAGIYFKPAQTASGPFDARAQFTQVKPSSHPEGYGIIVGGSDLTGAKQKYTYFLIRQDGRFLIKRRDGDQTKNVMNWTENAAIKKADKSGKIVNVLEIDCGQADIRFLVNGAEVASLAIAQIDTKGIIGLRVNHNLDVQIEGFSVRSSSSH